MDHLSTQLMEDIVLEPRGSIVNSQSQNKNSIAKKDPSTIGMTNDPPKPKVRLKVELQTLTIPQESERELYDTLKHIHGPSFKLSDASEFKNKKTNLSGQYWVDRGNLVIKGVVDYSTKTTLPKTHANLTKHFATSKLESYSFYPRHCLEALSHTNGDFGRALEILFEKYYNVNPLPGMNVTEEVNSSDLFEKRTDEKVVLESIYGDMFTEKIKNHSWLIKIKLNYLASKKTQPRNPPVVSQNHRKPMCKLFLTGKCRFGERCRFSHVKSEPPAPTTNHQIPDDDLFTLEIRFPEGNKYPYEPPYIYFYKNNMVFPSINYLMIAKRLFEEALELCQSHEPCVYTLISLLENEKEIKNYLQQNKANFIDEHAPLFPEVNSDQEIRKTHHEMGSTGRHSGSRSTPEETAMQDDAICSKFLDKQDQKNYKKMLAARRKLPIWARMSEILATVEDNPVVIISGETGCGKSTQVPQFLLDDWIINRNATKHHAEIICTQPRRISAIGVAERVASERDERIGHTVGYQIRLENRVSKWTRLTFCTTGILLQRLSSDPQLRGVSHIVVDEVHERSAESDFLLMLLKGVLDTRRDLRVILMSATLKAEAFSTYFAACPVLHVPGRTFPVQGIFLEDIFDQTGYVMEENSRFARKIRPTEWERVQIELETIETSGDRLFPPKVNIYDENLNLPQLIGRYPGHSQQTYKNLYLMNEEMINYELLEKVLEWIVEGEHKYPRDGSILVFLPGIADITAMKDLLNSNELFSARSGKFLVLPLHSMLSSEEQSLIFREMKPGVRKIVLSTNIAETSVTIDDCVFVVDTGRMKETRFNSNQNMECLEMCWVSRANAKQRQGRAGRVMPGVCVHLFTSHRFEHHFLASPVPEILRISLEPLLLRIRMINPDGNIELSEILGRVLEPPSRQSIFDATVRLQNVGAFDSQCNLTPLGHHLAALPVDVKIGKLILYGAIFCCVDSALTIAACLSHKSPFTTSFDRRHEVDTKKKEFSVAFSDQLTILKAYRKYQDIYSKSSYAGITFARENCLSVKTLQILADIKHQFLELLVSIGFVPIDVRKRPSGVDKVLQICGPELNKHNDNFKLLQGLLCAALYPNIVKIFSPEKSFLMKASGAIARQPKPDELKFQTRNDGFVFIHPSSVIFNIGHFPSPYLMYQEKIKTSKVFIREISAISILPLVLFSGYGVNIEQHNDSFILSLADGWILLAVESHTVAQLLQCVRKELVKLLEEKMRDPLLNLFNHPNSRIIQTIVSVLTRDCTI